MQGGKSESLYKIDYNRCSYIGNGDYIRGQAVLYIYHIEVYRKI